MQHYSRASDALILDFFLRRITSQKTKYYQHKKYELKAIRGPRKQPRDQEIQEDPIKRLRRYRGCIISSNPSVYP